MPNVWVHMAICGRSYKLKAMWTRSGSIWAPRSTVLPRITRPHTIAEKGGRAEQYGVLTKQQHLEPIPEQSVDNYPPGIPGLESTLPLLLTAASQGRIPYDLIPKLLDENPRRIFGLPIQPETWIEIDQNASYDFPDHPLYTKCGWSPFVGMRMTGLLRRVVLRGKKMFIRTGWF